MRSVRLALGAAVLALSLATASACDTGRDPQTIIANLPPGAGPTPGGGWQSSAWEESWLRYPGRATVIVEHDLGTIPAEVLVYLSFSPDGSAASLASGDTAHILTVDENCVVIENATHADFFFRVVLH
jgi:hypothetical protein